MAKNALQTAKDLLKIINPTKIDSYTNCLTRLRIKLKPLSEINLKKLKSVEGVLGVLAPSKTELQIVLGPGFVDKVAKAFDKLMEEKFSSPSIDVQSAKEVGQAFKIKLKSKHNRIQEFFTKFSKIFAPMIIGFIGAGILAGVGGILQSVYGSEAIRLQSAPGAVLSWFATLNVLLEIWKNAFIIIVGWRLASVFGGSGVLGAMAAAMYAPIFSNQVLSVFIVNQKDQSVNFLGFEISNPLSNWLLVGYRPAFNSGTNLLTLYNPTGNILGAMIAATTVLWIEKGLRKIVPGSLTTIVVPTVALFTILMLNFGLIVPISGYMYNGVAWFFSKFYTNPFGAAFLATIFLMTVAFGIHQGFVPIYVIVFNSTEVNGLFPILAMGGMAQIGAALALFWLSPRKSILRTQIQGALIPSILGIGEPMIYGVTLPRIKPFVTASLGAGFGGFFLGAMMYWGQVTFGLNATFGPSGILAAFMMTTPSGNIALAVSFYLIGALIAIMSGFVITIFAYSRVATAGLQKMKWQFKTKNGPGIVWKIGLIALWLTLIGLIAYWLKAYFELTRWDRLKLKTLEVI